MNIRAFGKITGLLLAFVLLLPVQVFAQDSPDFFTGINVTSPITDNVETTFTTAISYTSAQTWSWTEVYVDGNFYGCFNTPDHGATFGNTFNEALPVQGVLLSPGTYNIIMFQANSGSCNDVANLAAKVACVFTLGIGGALCPQDTLVVQTQSTVTVSKTFSDNSTANVTIDLACSDPNAVITPSASETVNKDTPRVFTVTGYAPGTTCTATEQELLGYVTDASACVNLALTSGVNSPCTITNRPTEATFTVNKNFSDSNPNLAVAVTPVCTDVAGGPAITYSPANGNAQHGTNFVTTVKYFNGVTNCTASEVDPVGYTQDLAVSTCDTNTAISDATDGTCIIHNQQDPVDIYADKIFTSGGGIATFAIDNCGGQGTVTVDTNTATPGSPAHYVISNFPYNGTTCNVTEPTPPDGYYEIASTCNGLVIVPSDDDTTCSITNAPTRATFAVTKEFTDGDNNDTEVEVTISCYTGLPLVQSQSIQQGDEVTFVVESFTHETLDCDVSEDLDAPELAGYTPTYIAGGTPGGTSDDDGCYFDDVPGGAENTCHIINDADPVTVEIEKDWIIEGTGGDQVNQNFELTLHCDAEIVGGEADGSGSSRNYGYGGCGNIPFLTAGKEQQGSQWCLELDGTGGTTFTPEVIPEWPGSHCWVDEKVYDDAVEVDNGCKDINVSHGEGDSCLITNTVFFEGIPTLSQYGMAIMALLMLGVGLVGFRRFV